MQRKWPKGQTLNTQSASTLPSRPGTKIRLYTTAYTWCWYTWKSSTPLQLWLATFILSRGPFLP
ncbi:hypothetical protein EYF80_042050 [Liparis tanakae]|uniref:Uncharacterized protein n=1 Tax=Liparis tanakae TaxID=230148 RepID=A0A4Z2G351_9TELE|nr:hypothetical protein EYF80_042050 [Liparis tanakae]